jgi:hypothetical protein
MLNFLNCFNLLSPGMGYEHTKAPKSLDSLRIDGFSLNERVVEVLKNGVSKDDSGLPIRWKNRLKSLRRGRIGIVNSEGIHVVYPWHSLLHILPANVARLLSKGPNFRVRCHWNIDEHDDDKVMSDRCKKMDGRSIG